MEHVIPYTNKHSILALLIPTAHSRMHAQTRTCIKSVRHTRPLNTLRMRCTHHLTSLDVTCTCPDHNSRHSHIHTTHASEDASLEPHLHAHTETNTHVTGKHQQLLASLRTQVLDHLRVPVSARYKQTRSTILHTHGSYSFSHSCCNMDFEVCAKKTPSTQTHKPSAYLQFCSGSPWTGSVSGSPQIRPCSSSLQSKSD
jgi:hypothetical protein